MPKTNNKTKYLAHISKDLSREQSCKEHTDAVANLSESFASKFNAGKFGKLEGLLHDIGKWVEKWQKLLLKKAGMTEEEKKKEEIMNHTSAGAMLIRNRIGLYISKETDPKKIEMLEFCKIVFSYLCFASHGGIPNFINTHIKKDGTSGRQTYSERIDKAEKEDLLGKVDFNDPDIIEIVNETDVIIQELAEMKKEDFPIKFKNGIIHFQLFIFFKMLFSCGVDADCIDTKEFMDEYKDDRPLASWEELKQKYEDYMIKLEESSPRSPINIARKEIREEVQSHILTPNNLYSTTIRTGGGKTLTDIGCGIYSCIDQGYDTIIYVVRYTNILAEIARQLQEVFGKENILVHYRNYERKSGWIQYSENGWEEDKDDTYKSAANWSNIRIILTTDVQFFETVFSNKNGRSRKMHNMCNSFIFFDEPQTLSPEFLLPCWETLKELTFNYNCTVLFSTATQPFRYQSHFPENFRTDVIELLEDHTKWDAVFDRTTVEDIKRKSTDQISDIICEEHQSLCILNSRNNVYNVFSELCNRRAENTYFLTTDLCPIHRMTILDQIRGHLLRGEKCLLISTCMVEAGVNLDFPSVYREITGIDSLEQARGRCNREGKMEDKGRFYIFSLTDGTPPNNIPYLHHMLAAMRDIKETFPNNILCTEAVESYFDYYYHYKNTDGREIWKRINNSYRPFEWDFEDINRDFAFIPNAKFDIVIPYDEKAEIYINNLEMFDNDVRWLAELHPYTVGVYEKNLEDLKNKGYIRMIKDKYLCLIDGTAYEEQTGLNENNRKT